MPTLKIKTGDNVRVIAGRDKGKTGKVIQVFPDSGRVVVENVNIMKKHLRSRGEQKGQRIELAAPMHASNVQIMCDKCEKPSKVKIVIVEGKKQRQCRRCSTAFGTK